ncbi:MAG: molybdopterin molybdotransferase MoeA [Opitutales bacterium]
MITVEQAEEKISREWTPRAIEKIPFGCSTGRILRASIKADRPLPPYDRVMMDGVVISAAGWATGQRNFQLAGLQLPGVSPIALENPKCCIKAMTGAPMPKGCTFVVPREEFEEEGDMICINESFQPIAEHYLHRCGTDCAVGDELISSGTKLGPNEIAVAASCGQEMIAVTQKIKLLVIDTGDELVEVGEPLTPYQIRRSNAHLITSACSQMAFVDATSTHCPDDKTLLSQRVASSLHAHDVILLCGGVSKGDRDYVPAVLKENGVEKCFHWVNQRPGKPLWFGRQPRGPLVFGLPGNPLSVLISFHRYVKAALLGLAGATPDETIKVALTERINLGSPKTIFLPVNLHSGKEGVLGAAPSFPKNSGDFASVLGTDGFIQLPSDQENAPAGFVATFFPW